MTPTSSTSGSASRARALPGLGTPEVGQQVEPQLQQPPIAAGFDQPPFDLAHQRLGLAVATQPLVALDHLGDDVEIQWALESQPSVDAERVLVVPLGREHHALEHALTKGLRVADQQSVDGLDALVQFADAVELPRQLPAQLPISELLGRADRNEEAAARWSPRSLCNIASCNRPRRKAAS